MHSDLIILAWTAAGIGLIHTITGPDHYLPFIVMGRARRWSLMKIFSITLLCGVGHIVGSVVLGFIGIGAGIAVHELVEIESLRGNIAAWGLTAFGLIYMLWGLRRAYRNRLHTHEHAHLDGQLHVHEHSHSEEHAHVHEEQGQSVRHTPWALFIIFILGPCEPLIPLLMFPAAEKSLAGIALIAGIFGVVTIATMTGIVVLVHTGVRHLPLGRLERYTHTLAGGTLTLSGLVVLVLKL
jgi:ABC-type nickel/cobalt efflux system permease component RcnA